jgi:hypothetical protein
MEYGFRVRTAHPTALDNNLNRQDAKSINQM